MSGTARLEVGGKSLDLPVIAGTEGELAVDTRVLRDRTGYITYDESYANTGSCQSRITFIDGEKGILRYRGIPIEEMAEHSFFVEAAYLVIYGKLPTEAERQRFSGLLTKYQNLHEDMKFHFEGFPSTAHPMAILSAMINAASCFIPELADGLRPASLRAAGGAAPLPGPHPGRVRLPQVPRACRPSTRARSTRYTENFLHMMFSEPDEDYELKPEVVKALDLIFLLHADHEQNCSTATVRMVASSRANLFASAAAGVCALWGPLHGGANQAVIEMLKEIRQDGR